LKAEWPGKVTVNAVPGLVESLSVRKEESEIADLLSEIARLERDLKDSQC
jgi:uncharacterized small protein (DUF1192 family)